MENQANNRTKIASGMLNSIARRSIQLIDFTGAQFLHFEQI